jgi:hypothetical protein
MPDCPGYVVRMIRDVTDDFLATDGDVAESFRGDAGGSRCEDAGGDEDRPLAARATWIGSKLGESFPRGALLFC